VPFFRAPTWGRSNNHDREIARSGCVSRLSGPGEMRPRMTKSGHLGSQSQTLCAAAGRCRSHLCSWPWGGGICAFAPRHRDSARRSPRSVDIVSGRHDGASPGIVCGRIFFSMPRSSGESAHEPYRVRAATAAGRAVLLAGWGGSGALQTLCAVCALLVTPSVVAGATVGGGADICCSPPQACGLAIACWGPHWTRLPAGARRPASQSTIATMPRSGGHPERVLAPSRAQRRQGPFSASASGWPRHPVLAR